MPSVALPGSSNNVSPVWLCIAPYKTKATNVGGGQPSSVFVKFADGKIMGYESMMGCAESLGVPPDVVYKHINKLWLKHNTMGIQFASNIELFGVMAKVEIKPVPTIKKTKTIRPIKVCKEKIRGKPQRKYKIVARYNDGRIINCYSAADASRKTGVHKRTVLKYIDRKWDSNNKYGLQFVTISKEA